MHFEVTQSDGSTREVDADQFYLDAQLVVFTADNVRVAAFPVGEVLGIIKVEKATTAAEPCCAEPIRLDGVESFVITSHRDAFDPPNSIISDQPEIHLDFDFELDEEGAAKLLVALFPRDQLRCSVWQNVAHGPWFWEVLEQKADGTLHAVGQLSKGTYGGGQESTKATAKDAAQRFVEKHFERIEREARIAEHRATTTEVHMVEL
jgi:hypothetical protein